MAGRKEDARATEWVAWQALVRVLQENKIDSFDETNPNTVVSAIVGLIDERDELQETVALQELPRPEPNSIVYDSIVRAFVAMSQDDHMPYSSAFKDLDGADFRVLAAGISDQLMRQWFGVV